MNLSQNLQNNIVNNDYCIETIPTYNYNFNTY